MARKRNSNSDGGINLDSLMDALTNVVAVLILVLVLVQADATRKVQEFLDDLKPATPEQIAESKVQLQELENKQKQVEAKLEEEPPSPTQIEEEKRKVALLEKSLEENKVKLADLNKLRKLEKKVRTERDKENQLTVTVQEEIAKIEAMLDETPKLPEDSATVVNLPNSRPIPNDAVVYYAMALRGRLHIIDPTTPRKIFEEEFKKHRQDWLQTRIKQKGSDRFVYDGQKIAAYFKDFDWGNTRGQKIEITAAPTDARLLIKITPDPKTGGTATEDLAKPGGEFYKAAASFLRNFNSVLLYRVNPDSFDTYLAARTLSDKANIASGWEVNGSGEYRERIQDIEIKRLIDPPKPPPDAKPKPPGPPPIPTKLD